jgi:diadenosine tetraphosphate (Ap4A) HIT family hydrolase
VGFAIRERRAPARAGGRSSGAGACAGLARGCRNGVVPDEACPFCERLRAGDVTVAAGGAAAFPDGYPVAEGHTLVVATRHEPDFFALSEGEQADIWGLVASVRQALVERLRPAGFNIGLNSGRAAGQTVDHAHVHVIPRFSDDVEDPRGGVRWVLPAKAAYWK